MLVPRNNGVCILAHFDKSGNGTDGVLVTETPEVMIVAMGE